MLFHLELTYVLALSVAPTMVPSPSAAAATLTPDAPQSTNAPAVPPTDLRPPIDRASMPSPSQIRRFERSEKVGYGLGGAAFAIGLGLNLASAFFVPYCDDADRCAVSLYPWLGLRAGALASFGLGTTGVVAGGAAGGKAEALREWYAVHPAKDRTRMRRAGIGLVVTGVPLTVALIAIRMYPIPSCTSTPCTRGVDSAFAIGESLSMGMVALGGSFLARLDARERQRTRIRALSLAPAVSRTMVQLSLSGRF